MIPEVEETRPWGGGRGKGSPSVSKGPKQPIQLLQLLKNSLSEVKRAHFRYILGPPGPTQELEFMGPGGEGPSRSPPPGFSGHDSRHRGVGRRGTGPLQQFRVLGTYAYRRCMKRIGFKWSSPPPPHDRAMAPPFPSCSQGRRYEVLTGGGVGFIGN